MDEPMVSKQVEVPVDEELAKELVARHEQATERGDYHEREARQWRNVEHACSAAVESLSERMSQGEGGGGVRG